MKQDKTFFNLNFYNMKNADKITYQAIKNLVYIYVALLCGSLVIMGFIGIICNLSKL